MSKKPLVRNKKHRGLTKANVKLEKVIVDIENIAKKIFKGKKGGGFFDKKVDPDVNKSIQDFLEKNRDKMKKLKNKLIDDIFNILNKSIKDDIKEEVKYKEKLIYIVLNINKLDNNIFDDEILVNDPRTPTISAIIILNTIIKYSNSQSIMKKINNNELDIEIDHYKDILERIKTNYHNDKKIQEENNKLLNEELGNIIKIRKFFNKDSTYKKEDKNALFSELNEKIEKFDPINSLNKKKTEFNFDNLIQNFNKLKEGKYVEYKLSRFHKINKIIIDIENFQTTDIVFPKIYTDEYDVNKDDFSTTITTDGNTKTVKGEQAWFDYNRRAINIEQITKNVIQEKFNEFEKQYEFETKIANMIESYNKKLKDFSNKAIKDKEIEEYFKTEDLNNTVEQINKKINILNYDDENQDTELTKIIEELKKLDNTINVAIEITKTKKAEKKTKEVAVEAKEAKEAVEAKDAALALAAEQVKAKDAALALAAEAEAAAKEAAKEAEAEAEAQAESNEKYKISNENSTKLEEYMKRKKISDAYKNAKKNLESLLSRKEKLENDPITEEAFKKVSEKIVLAEKKAEAAEQALKVIDDEADIKKNVDIEKKSAKEKAAAEKAAAEKAAAEKAAAEAKAAEAELKRLKDLNFKNNPLIRSNSSPSIIGGKLVAKYKSTGESVYILYNKKKIKRCVYEKTKGRGKYCKIDGEYKLLSKLKIM